MVAIVIVSNLLQLADLCGVADVMCWDFVSSDMAMASSPHSTTQLSNPGDVYTFISMLAQNVAEFPKNEVCMRRFINEAQVNIIMSYVTIFGMLSYTILYA